MANIFKKLIAGISTAAILATLAVPVAMAGEDDIVFYEDYTAEDASAASWSSFASINANGLLLTHTNSGTRASTVTLEESVEDSVVVEYETRIRSLNGASTIWIGPSGASSNNYPSDAITTFQIQSIGSGATTATGAVNGNTFTVGVSNRTTEWLQVKQIINAASKEVTTTVTANDNIIYNGTASYTSSSFKVIGAAISRDSSTIEIKGIKIYTVDAPSVELEDVNRIEVGVPTKIATVTGTEEVNVTPDNSAFAASVENGVVYITAQEGTESGTSTTVEIEAVGEVTVSKSIDLVAQTAQEIAESVVSNIEISGENVTKNENGSYTVLGGFTVPVSDGAADISWKSDNSAVNIDSEGNATIGSSIAGTITLTATADYNGAEATKDFTIIIPSNKIFYNVDFNDASVGNIASVDGPGTGEIKGIEAHVVTRSGSSNCNYVSIANGLSDSNYLAVVSSNYNEDKGTKNTRRTYLDLLRMQDVTIANTLHINFDIRMGKTTSSLVFTDGINEITINTDLAPGMEVDNWYNVNIDSTPADKTSVITVKDAEGNKISSDTTSTCLNNLTRINTNGGNDIYFYIDNFVVADAVIPVINQLTDTVLLGESEAVAEVKNATDISIELSNNDVFEAQNENGKIIVTSKAIEQASTVVTITAENEGIVVKETYTISSLGASDITGAAKAQNTVYYTSDKKGTVIKPEIADGATIYNDLVLPTTEKVTINGFTYTADVTWEVTSGSEYLSADGIISVPDENAHEVILKKTVSYTKNGEVKATDSVEYKLNVKFAHAEVLSGVNAAIEAVSEIKDEDKAELLKAAVYEYQVKFDAAYDANFSSIPSSATSNITLPVDGHFGSTFIWSSSAPTVISNQGKYTKPSSSKTVTMTASIISGSASAEKSFSISVPVSTGGGGGGGGSTSSTGTTNKGTSSSVVATSTSTAGVDADTSSAADRVAQLQQEALESNDLFTDISQAAWARDEINGLAKAGVINGKTDTLFAPNDTVTRAEFAKMLMGTLGLASNAYTTSSFADVSTDAWYFEYVESAYNLGIINGVGEGIFAPNALITRQDMAVMVARAAAIAGKDIAEVSEAKNFADAASISDYAKTAVDTLVKGGVINGMSDTEFAPLANATRAQAAKILYKFL